MGPTELAVLFGILLFAVPAAFFGWLVATRRGRRAWSRIADKQQRLSERAPRDLEDLPVVGWLEKHLVATTIGVAALEVLLALTAGARAWGPMIQFGGYWVLIVAARIRRRRAREGGEVNRAS